MNKLMNFSGLGRIGMMLVIAVVFAVTAIGVGDASAATGGVLKNMFPPGNKGTSQGVGMIDGHDGNKYVFHIPGGNGGTELTEGDEVFFELGNGRKVHSVTQESSNPIGEAGYLVDSETERKEGKKGLNAVNVKTLSRDDGESTWEWVQEYVLGREMVMPGDNLVLHMQKAKVLEAFVNAQRGKDYDSIDNAPEEKERGIGHTVGAGIVAEIVKGILGDSPIVIELPMSKGTVKFFNESKSFGGKVIDIVIKINGSEV
jgi:cold shock CspA family protein